jgi:hypothetical protein
LLLNLRTIMKTIKIKKAADEEVNTILTNGKLLLKFATLSVIESLRMNPKLYNFVIHDNSNNTTISYGSDFPSLTLSEQQQQQQLFNYTYTVLILQEAEKLYNKLIIELTNRVIASVATGTIRASSLPLPAHNNNRN